MRPVQQPWARPSHLTEAATATLVATAQPVGQVQELDEIWVRGKRPWDVIADAESDLFRLYNKLNKNNQFDIHCSHVRLNRDSLAMTRTCLPQYIPALYERDEGDPGFLRTSEGGRGGRRRCGAPAAPAGATTQLHQLIAPIITQA
jgi:hypothetical protein